jgi:hypothetical protein
MALYNVWQTGTTVPQATSTSTLCSAVTSYHLYCTRRSELLATVPPRPKQLYYKGMRMAARGGNSALVSCVLTGCHVRPQRAVDRHGSAYRLSDSSTPVCSKVPVLVAIVLPRNTSFYVVRGVVC